MQLFLNKRQLMFGTIPVVKIFKIFTEALLEELSYVYIRGDKAL